jgi:hypothetical protein
VPALLIKAVSTTQWSARHDNLRGGSGSRKAGQAIGSESGVSNGCDDCAKEFARHVMLPPCIVFAIVVNRKDMKM